MNPSPRPLSELLPILRCPACKAELVQVTANTLRCSQPACGCEYPVIGQVPVLINEHTSVFRIQDFLDSTRASGAVDGSRSGYRERILHFLPTANRNLKAGDNYQRLAHLLLDATPNPRILVVGGRVIGQGFDRIISHPQLEFVETDVSFGPRTAIVCDASDLPFDPATFDAVVVQAVLEHVVDPYRCVAEIHRVLKPSGLVYAETPFMQQVHEGAYDFTRFTQLGHRRLFRCFDEIESGAVSGPGMALAWAWRYFLLSFTTSGTLRGLATVFAQLTSFWLRVFDPYLINRPGALDAASGFYFLGRRSDTPISDREIIRSYRGCVGLSHTRTKVK